MRFFYALPLCLTISFLLKEGFDAHVPKANGKFLIFAVLGGSAQILATILLIYLFTLKKFAVGGAFKKTEALISVGIGFMILQESVSLFSLVAISNDSSCCVTLRSGGAEVDRGAVRTLDFFRDTATGLACSP